MTPFEKEWLKTTYETPTNLSRAQLDGRSAIRQCLNSHTRLGHPQTFLTGQRESPGAEQPCETPRAFAGQDMAGERERHQPESARHCPEDAARDHIRYKDDAGSHEPEAWPRCGWSLLWRSTGAWDIASRTTTTRWGAIPVAFSRA